MRDYKLERRLLTAARQFPTIGELRGSACSVVEIRGVLKISEHQPEGYPSSLAIEDYLCLLD